MKNPASDLERRRPVWNAMSELYLDTKLELDDLKRIANVLRSSRYCEAELELIMFGEVFPVLIPNLWSMAGEWSGFDLESFHGAILDRQSRRLKFPTAMIPGRSLVRDDWRIIKELLLEKSGPNHEA